MHFVRRASRTDTRTRPHGGAPFLAVSCRVPSGMLAREALVWLNPDAVHSLPRAEALTAAGGALIQDRRRTPTRSV
jgi:hypothetical protein